MKKLLAFGNKLYYPLVSLSYLLAFARRESYIYDISYFSVLVPSSLLWLKVLYKTVLFSMARGLLALSVRISRYVNRDSITEVLGTPSSDE